MRHAAIRTRDGKKAGQTHTFTMDPQEETCRLPFLKCAALSEPRRSSIEVISACDVMVCRGIRRGEPASDVLLKLIPCEAHSDRKSTNECRD
jgi:hypothetical protein